MASVDMHTGVMTSPKHAPLSDGAFRLWAHGVMWSKEHLTDGFIPAGMLGVLHKHGAKYVGELLRVIVHGKGPLWHEVEGGYQIHDYEHWQETKGRVQDRRQQWRDRQQKKRDTQGSHAPVTRDTRRDSRVSHANLPSDGIGSGLEEKKPPTPKGVSDPLFAAFWDAYPRHVGKAAALKAWLKINPDADLVDAMVKALSWQRQQPAWTKDDGAYIPHPSTWLNHRRWEDEEPASLLTADDGGGGTPLEAWKPRQRVSA